MKDEVEIIQVADAADFALARNLFEEYAAAIEVDLCFQNFSSELQQLATMYGPPRGALLIAHAPDGPAGCVGVRHFHNGVCEMKRLYVRPPFRGRGLGRRLAEAAVVKGQALGYETMVLDTLASMKTAHALYVTMGFQPAEAYYGNPLPDVRYLARDLRLDVGRVRSARL